MNLLIYYRLLLFLVMIFLISPILAERSCADQKEGPPNQPEYFLGIFPYLPASRLEGVFAPIAAEISTGTGKRVHYRSASDFKRFMAKLGKCRVSRSLRLSCPVSRVI